MDQAGDRAQQGRLPVPIRAEDDHCLAILDVLRPASPNARGQTGALLDLYFAITSNSGTWAADEITGWFRDAGLKPARPIHLRTAPGVSVMTAVRPG